MRKISLVIVALLVIGAVPVVAQEDCALVFQEAVNTAQQMCMDTGGNQIC